ncbi:phosphotransferase [Nitrincola iocasae]|uniref:Phosphotransferase n=1 Tax=Nitrincola iocasae TaxID=2614693 RepID=A0A5J6LI09_9GAMM|nr:phosphotransferase [Nitrincola iocasae]QEW08229.1 phosphotransferase [Nitrincola iocasae]
MNLALPKEVKQQLVFLLAEVRTQLQNLILLLDSPSATLTRAITERSGHSYNLKQRTHIRCLKAFSDNERHDPQSLKAAGDLADELERITSLCREAARELQHLKHRKMLQQHKYRKRLMHIDNALHLVEQILMSNDTQAALEISKVQQKLVRFYKKARTSHLTALKKHKQTEALISSLFLARHIMDMGSALINISESLLAVLLGQPMNMKQFLSLQAMVSSLGHDEWDNLTLETIAETRSGSAISAISQDDDQFIGVLKEGALRKVQEERRGLERWNEIIPGIAPQVLSQHHKGSSGALIIEHLPGNTLEQLVLKQAEQPLSEAMELMCDMLPKIWQSTKRKGKVSPAYIQQLKKRLPAVLSIHPGFNSTDTQIGGVKRPALNQLLNRAASLDEKLPAPFSVYIHGDFNLDNILYEQVKHQLRFIDLHRSGYMDYVQDVSVFIVSGLRLPLFDKHSRACIERISTRLYETTASFAEAQKDTGFERRMALGLARSLITSTRFILDEAHARSLFERGFYLLEHLVAHQDSKDYPLPLKEILNV